MRAAGMSVRSDPIGNLIGRYEGIVDMTIVLGSHLDTVRDAGRYDGIPQTHGLLARAVEEVGYPIERMPSGADHDAAAVAKIASIAMLFVRCRGGIGHNSAQLIEPEDVAVGRSR